MLLPDFKIWDPDFKIWELQQNIILHPLICHETWKTFICSAAQYFYWFVMVFIYCLLSFFIDAADNEHTYLVEIPIEC